MGITAVASRPRSRQISVAGGKPMLRGIHHLALVTDNMRVTLDFYVRVLGMPIVHGLRTPSRPLGASRRIESGELFVELRHELEVVSQRAELRRAAQLELHARVEVERILETVGLDAQAVALRGPLERVPRRRPGHCPKHGSPAARIVVTKCCSEPMRFSSPIRTARSLAWMT